MEFTGTPPVLPLDAAINRCLAHGHQAGEWCELRYACACHETIKHDVVPVPVCYRKCMTEHMAGYVPMSGFHDINQISAAERTTKAGSGDVTPAASDCSTVVDGGVRTDPPGKAEAIFNPLTDENHG